jgi:GT2 family glycosyltransferase
MDQIRRPDGILVVDNGSEDGTVELVKERFPDIQLIEFEQNVGHMGAFELVVKTAFQQGYDAVLSVDDDARLKKDTLECLLRAIDTHEGLSDSLIWCANISFDGEYFTEPASLKVGDEWKIYHRFLPEVQGKVFETLGGANIGIFIPRPVFEKVGPPMSVLAFNGEPEFKYRVQKAGFKLYYCLSSIIYHKRHMFTEVFIRGDTRFISKVPPWHTYYEIRNTIYVDILYKRRTMFKCLTNIAFISAMKIYTCDKKISTLLHIVRAVYDGLLGNMGMTAHIPRLLHDKQKKK